MVAIFIVLALSFIPIYGQNMFNTTANSANTIENTAEENRDVGLDPITPSTNKIDEIDSTELLNQVGEAAKRIAMGGANVLSNISGEIKKGLQ
jgi:hypothetical protein